MRLLMKSMLTLVAALGLALPAAAQDFPERGTAPVADAANLIGAATERVMLQFSRPSWPSTPTSCSTTSSTCRGPCRWSAGCSRS